LAYIAFFSIGLGPITGVYTSEISPLQVRALGFAVGGACNRVTSAVISMTFLYSGIAALAWVFFFTYLPETRGQTLEEMGKLFGMEDTDMAETENTAAKEKVVEMPTS